jgi:hypothetical protein
VITVDTRLQEEFETQTPKFRSFFIYFETHVNQCMYSNTSKSTADILIQYAIGHYFLYLSADMASSDTIITYWISMEDSGHDIFYVTMTVFTLRKE